MYFVRRVLWLIPLMLVISFLAFVLVRIAPGGPFDRERTQASAQSEQALKRKYHLDEPFLKQYVRYLGDLLRGDFGPSLKYRSHNINDVIAQGLPISLTLGALAFCFAMAVGIPLGIHGALRKGHWDEQLGSVFTLLTFCVPGLVLGPLLVLFFGIQLKWFPVAMWESPWHAILPTITLGLFYAGRVARLMREGMLGVLHSEFITTARAKGLSESRVIFRHAFRLAILPVLSYSGPMLADLLTGSFVVEKVFQIPGIGVFLVNSVLNRDHAMLVALVVVYAVVLLVLNLVVDLLYALLDPRVKYE